MDTATFEKPQYRTGHRVGTRIVCFALGAALLVVTSAGIGAVAQRAGVFTGKRPQIVREHGGVGRTHITPPTRPCVPNDSGRRIVLVATHTPARRCADPTVLD